MSEHLRITIERCWDEREQLALPQVKKAIEETISLLDSGRIRVASPGDAQWIVNDWVKKAVILYFQHRKMEVTSSGPFEFHDKIPLKTGFKELGVRVVPQALARFGSYLAPGVILMPSYVNIGAYVDSGTMVDTWATVGSCAQIGKNVHLSGGVGIGGVLEPIMAAPVIIEDDCFIGSRCIIVEGALIHRQCVLGANVVITGSTRIIDVSGPEPVEYKGMVPERSVVIPGSLPKTFPSGTYHVPCALIIGKRKASTDLKTSLNDALREYNLSI
ncbi:MAG: 2,3,4,5-tetrahydropyridine-2,6-dicarboxylate N-succinyltransferase [Bacteroidales bacterium]